MTYQASVRPLPTPPTITTLSTNTLGIDRRLSVGAGVAAAVWPAVRRVIYVPLFIQSPYRILRLWWINGATVNGNVDCGVYSAAAGLPVSKLVSSGSVAQSGASTIQTATVDYVLAPGQYFLALMCDSGTATFYRVTGGMGTYGLRLLGMTSETPGAMPLPATATPIGLLSNVLPVFGIASVALI